MNSISPRAAVGTVLVAATLVFVTGCSSMLRSSARHRRNQPLSFEKWKPYTAEDGSFMASLPGAPKATTRQQTTTKTSSYQSKTGGQVYTVNVSTALSDEAAFRRDSDSGAVKRRADILSKEQKEVKLAGESAVECKWDQGAVHHRAVLLKTHQGTHLYCLGATWKTSQEPPSVQKFFDSFKPGAYTPKPVPSVTPTPETSPEPAEDISEAESSGSPTPDDDDE